MKGDQSPHHGFQLAELTWYGCTNWNQHLWPLSLSLTCRVWHHHSCIVQPWRYADH